MQTYNTINEITSAHKALGLHFFDPSALRFFNSKVLPTVYRNHYFITSEKHKDDPRLYTVRACLDGKIETIGHFQAFKTVAQARGFIYTLPSELGQAFQCLTESFNKGKMDEFITHATLEQVNNKEGTYSLDSFCGACAWMFENYELLDSSVLKNYFEDYQKRLLTYNQ